MNIKENLKKAIQKSDWSEVCSIYESMFGESIIPPNNIEAGIPSDLVKKIRSTLRDVDDLLGEPMYSDNDQEELHHSSEDMEEDVVEEEPESPLQEFHTNQSDSQSTFVGSVPDWEKNVEVQFLSSEDYSLPEDDMSNYKQALETHGKRTKHTREVYTPHMMKCSKCGIEFDYNKEYPAGMLDSSRGIKCNKCRLAG